MPLRRGPRGILLVYIAGFVLAGISGKLAVDARAGRDHLAARPETRGKPLPVDAEEEVGSRR